MRIFLLLVFCFSLFQLTAQKQSNFQSREYWGAQADAIVPGAEHIWVKQENIIPTFIKFRPERGFAEEVFFLHINKIFHLPSNYSFKLLKTEEDKLGLSHKRYQLLVDNVPVFSGIFQHRELNRA